MAFLYGPGAQGLVQFSGTPSLEWLVTGDLWRLGLSDSTHVPDQDDTFLDDVGADDFVDGELSGTGYGRVTMTTATQAITYDAANNRVELDNTALITFTAINAGTAAQATIFNNTGADDAARRMVCDVDTGGFPVVTNGGDVTITWNADGIMQLTV